MMDGVRLLNIVQNPIMGWGISGTVILCGTFALMFLGLSIWCVIIMTKNNVSFNSDILLSFILTICMIIATIAVASTGKPVDYYETYQVCFEGEVNAEEFLEKYEVLEQNGEIYLIKEKDIS